MTKKETLINSMYNLITSDEFTSKDIEYQDHSFVNKDSDIQYFKFLNSLEDIPNDKPYVYFSEFEDVLSKLGSEFDIEKWDSHRLSSMTGVEFDYIFQIQHNRLGLDLLDPFNK